MGVLEAASRSHSHEKRYRIFLQSMAVELMQYLNACHGSCFETTNFVSPHRRIAQVQQCSFGGRKTSRKAGTSFGSDGVWAWEAGENSLSKAASHSRIEL